MSDANQEIRALIAPMSGSNILLPGTMIAEVVNYSEPEPYAGGPDWLLGELRWNGWQIPLVNFALLVGSSDDASVPARSRVLVVKTLSIEASVLHIGLVIEGLPKLKSVTPDTLVEVEGEHPAGVFSQVTIDDLEAVIPDLDELALTIEKAVYTR